MSKERAPRRTTVERMDPEMVEVLRAKTGAERMAIAFGMLRSTRRLIASQLRSVHPGWDEDTLRREVARRIPLGSG